VSSDQRINFDLVPTKTFLRDLKRLDKDTNQRIISSLEDLRRDPYSYSLILSLILPTYLLA
jgi:hypothetical protein